MSNNFTYNKKHLPFGHSAAIMDDKVLSRISEFNLSFAENEHNVDIKDKFLTKYLEWIQATKINTVQGLDSFKYKCYSNGTTESFDKFYQKHKSRRFRCFRGEYLYHRLVWRNNYPNWVFADDECLDPNDAVVISLPFSNTGNIHQLHEDMLNVCDEKNIPVLVDCCYLGICSNIDFNFNHKSIEEVVFSLSKTFPVAHTRIGMRLSRIDDDDSLFVVNKNNYTNRTGAALGLHLINNFSADYIPTKYKDKQKIFCDYLKLTPSNTVLFGLDYENKYAEYARDKGSNDSDVNRLSLHKFLPSTLEVLKNA